MLARIAEGAEAEAAWIRGEEVFPIFVMLKGKRKRGKVHSQGIATIEWCHGNIT